MKSKLEKALDLVDSVSSHNLNRKPPDLGMARTCLSEASEILRGVIAALREPATGSVVEPPVRDRPGAVVVETDVDKED